MLAIVNNAAMNIGLPVSFQISRVFFFGFALFWFLFFGIYPGVELLGHIVVLFLVF